MAFHWPPEAPSQPRSLVSNGLRHTIVPICFAICSQDANDDNDTIETTARLFQTSGGKFIVGVEDYNRTTEQYAERYAFKADTLAELVEVLRLPLNDPDLLAELFDKTEVADSLTETVE